jgi:hypothetical protein
VFVNSCFTKPLHQNYASETSKAVDKGRRQGTCSRGHAAGLQVASGSRGHAARSGREVAGSGGVADDRIRAIISVFGVKIGNYWS